MTGFSRSGWQDSNLRPPAPKAGAITGLRYTPIKQLALKKQYTNPKFQKNYLNQVAREPGGVYPERRLAESKGYTPMQQLALKKTIYKSQIAIVTGIYLRRDRDSNPGNGCPLTD